MIQIIEDETGVFYPPCSTLLSAMPFFAKKDALYIQTTNLLWMNSCINIRRKRYKSWNHKNPKLIKTLGLGLGFKIKPGFELLMFFYVYPRFNQD